MRTLFARTFTALAIILSTSLPSVSQTCPGGKVPINCGGTGNACVKPGTVCCNNPPNINFCEPPNQCVQISNGNGYFKPGKTQCGPFSQCNTWERCDNGTCRRL